MSGNPRRTEADLHRPPTWTKLDHAGVWTGDWQSMRAEIGLDWEVEEDQVFIPTPTGLLPQPNLKGLFRSDKGRAIIDKSGKVTGNPEALLAVQPKGYATINNRMFGEAMETVMSRAGDEFGFETFFELDGGRQLVLCLKANEPMAIGGDPSKTFEFVTFLTRHDGNGSFKGIPMQQRMWCSNMLKASERSARHAKVGFNIPHRLNWREQIEKAAEVIGQARSDAAAWEALANRLVGKKLTPRMTVKYLEAMFPINENTMTDRQITGAIQNREAVKTVLNSPTCAGVEGTLYGFTQAVVEWADHIRPARNASTRTARSLLGTDPAKRKVFSLARHLLS